MNPAASRRRDAIWALLPLCFPAQDAPPAPPVVTGAAVAAPADSSVTETVVKVFAQQRYPDFLNPWSKESPTEATGSGVLIDGRRILTNAHVVQWASRVELQPYRSSKKYAAEIVGIAPAVDLAVLAVTKDADEFFADRQPIAMQDELPKLRAAVGVFGYPMGGSDLSVTEGIVSRVEYTGFDLDRAGLIIQIDAAINPGNSGGPALVQDRLVGLATSRLSSGDNIGFLTPVEEIQAFLADLEDGSYQGRPRLFDSFQTLENDALRARLGLAAGVTGLVVTEPADPAPGYPLQRLDVVTHIGDREIAVDGKVAFDGDLRLDFGVLVPQFARDGHVPLRVARGSQSLELSVPVAPRRDLLVDYLGSAYPSYFIHGPLVFSPCYREFGMGLADARTEVLVFDESPLLARMNEVAPGGEELVMLLPTLFDHALTRGYGRPQFAVVDTLNGTVVENLAHLVELLRDSTETYLELAFAGRGQEVLVFEREELERSTEEILDERGIRYRHSADLDGIWPADR
jgi:S1-C subfamily serine protease